MYAITRPGTLCVRSPELRSFWPSQGAFQWEPPAPGAVIAMMPCLSVGLAAAVLNSFDWCYGEVQVALAVCLSGAGASGTLLLRWNFYPANMGRAVAYAAAAGLGGAAPLFLCG
jgi:hypothetical protein